MKCHHVPAPVPLWAAANGRALGILAHLPGLEASGEQPASLSPAKTIESLTFWVLYCDVNRASALFSK